MGVGYQKAPQRSSSTKNKSKNILVSNEEGMEVQALK